MNLRDYQQEALTAIWNEINQRQTALCVMATGAGKSIVIASLLEKAIKVKPDVRCLVLFNKVTLLSQLAERFQALLGNEKIGIYCGSKNEKNNTCSVTVGSIQSIYEDTSRYNLIVIDEVHALDEEKGRYIKLLKRQMADNDRVRIVGFTATPFRLNGYIYGKGRFFERPCYDRGIRFFIDRKNLVPPICKQPDHQIDVSKLRVVKGEYRQDDIDAQTLNEGMARDQVIDALNRAVGRKKIVWQCASINHAELINKILLEEEELSVTLHSKLDEVDRANAQFQFEQGNARHLTFVTIVSEGYDYPAIDTIVLMRPTRSPGIMVQTIGRGLRPIEGKESCLVLDYANVVSTLGPIEDPVIHKKKKGEKLQQTQKACPQCRTYVAPRAMECPSCGFNWPKLEATKNALTANEEVEFFKKEGKIINIKNVRIKAYTSKAGNSCYQITYEPMDIFLDELNEFFLIEKDYSLSKFLRRAIDLRIKVSPDPNETVKNGVHKIPKAVEYKMEGKYPKIRRLIF